MASMMAFARFPRRPGNARHEQWESGDIIFLNGNSFRGKAVRLLQGYCSDYSHVGIVVIEGGVPFVVNADPVQDKVIEQRWDMVVVADEVSGGAIFRLRNANMAAKSVACEVAKEYLRENVPFDHNFDLKTKGRLFCTELVWRAYRRAGVDLCKNAEELHPHLFPADLLMSPELKQVIRF